VGDNIVDGINKWHIKTTNACHQLPQQEIANVYVVHDQSSLHRESSAPKEESVSTFVTGSILWGQVGRNFAGTGILSFKSVFLAPRCFRR